MPVIISKGLMETDPRADGYVGCSDGSIYVDGKKTFPSYDESTKAANDTQSKDVTVTNGIRQYTGKVSKLTHVFGEGWHLDGKKITPEYMQELIDKGIFSKDLHPICKNCPESMVTTTRGFECDENDENAPDILFCKELGYPCDQIKKCPLYISKPISDL